MCAAEAVLAGTDTEGLTAVLADFAAGPSRGVEDHAAAVERALVDTVGVALASASEPAERILQAWAAREAGTGRATVWTTGGTVGVSMAALLNGAAAHQLDYDDISPSMPLHPSAVLVPALLAVSQDRGVDGRRIVAAYDVGAAAFRAVAELLPQHVHYARGWHTTATVGRLAATAALVHLVGASTSTAQHALGIVSSLVSGSRLNFGSMTKPLHAGFAARDAVMALELAEAGLTANPEELEAPDGFFDRYGDPDLSPIGDPDETLAERLEYWVDAWPRDWGIKRYPACYGTHRAIDAVLALRPRLSPDEVRTLRSVHVTVHPRGTRPLVAFPPASAAAAKFSLEYTVASALLRGPARLADFTDVAFDEAGVRELMARVGVAECAEPPCGPGTFSGGYAVVEVVTEEGRRLTERVDVTRGDARDPLSEAELAEKLLDCSRTAGLSDAAADALRGALRSLVSGGSSDAVAAVLTAPRDLPANPCVPTTPDKELSA